MRHMARFDIYSPPLDPPGTWFRAAALLAVLAFCFLAPVAVAVAADLNVNGTMTLAGGQRTYQNVTGSGLLVLDGCELTADKVDAYALDLDMDNHSKIKSDSELVVRHMELNDSTLEAAGRISGTVTAPRQLFLENSTILSTGGNISLGEGYSGFHIHNNSKIIAEQGEVLLYGGLRVLQGTSFVTAGTNIFGSILEALGNAELHVKANGKVTSNSLIATTLEAQSLQGINVTVREEFNVGTVDITRGQGSLVLTGAKDKNTVTALNLANARAEINGLTVEGQATISGGSFSGQDVVLKQGATFSGGARAAMETLELTETLLAVNSRVAVNNLNGNGNIVVGTNAAVGLGTADVDWIERQFSTADGSSLAPVMAALAVAQSQNISGLGILVDGNATTASPPTPGEARFAADSLLVVSAAAADRDGDGALHSGTFEVDSGAKLYIPDAVDGGAYRVLDGTITYMGDAWTGDNLLAGTPLLALERRMGAEIGWFYARRVSAGKTFTRLHPYLVDMLDEAYAEGLIGYSQRNSDIPGIRFLSRAISREYIANDGRLAASTIESAARMAALGAVPQMTMAANQAGSNAMGRRTGAEPGGGVRAVGEDGAPVEEALNRHGWALWIMPIFQSTNGFGMTAGNWDMDFSGNLGGIALGCDYTFASALRLGVSLNLGGGYARGSGELAGTTNSMGFWGLGAYAGWRTGNLGLSADVAYTSTYNSLKQGLPEGMEMRPLKSDVTSRALSTGLRAEYRIPAPWLDVTPHAGVRYLYLHTDGYDVKSNGTVLEGDPMRQNIWTFPVGVSLSREFGLPHGWRCRPVLDLSVIPAAGDMDAKGDVRFTGTGIDSDLETQIMDHVTWRGAFGMEFTGGDLALGLAYSFQGGMKTTAHGVTASFSYQF